VERYIPFWSGAYPGRGVGYPGGLEDTLVGWVHWCSRRYPGGEADTLVERRTPWWRGGYHDGKEDIPVRLVMSWWSGGYPGEVEDTLVGRSLL
jgi:hypothetical protein